MPRIATKLKELREEANMTQQALAMKAGISRSLIAKYECGEKDIEKATYETVKKLCDALYCEPVDLLDADITAYTKAKGFHIESRVEDDYDVLTEGLPADLAWCINKGTASWREQLTVFEYLLTVNKDYYGYNPYFTRDYDEGFVRVKLEPTDVQIGEVMEATYRFPELTKASGYELSCDVKIKWIHHLIGKTSILAELRADKLESLPREIYEKIDVLYFEDKCFCTKGRHRILIAAKQGVSRLPAVNREERVILNKKEIKELSERIKSFEKNIEKDASF